MRMTPVACAVKAFGGANRLAEALEIHRNYVWRWENGALAGEVPSARRMRQILEAANLRGITLTANDLVFGRDAENQQA